VVWQFFSGMAYYEPRLPCDATQIGRFRRVLGEAGVEQLLKSTIEASVAMQLVKPAEFERVIVGTTVQEKAIAHPTDSRLLEIARYKMASAAKRCGIAVKQTFVKQGKQLRRKAGGYAHAKQFRRLARTVKRQRTILGRLMRDVQRGVYRILQGDGSGVDLSAASTPALKTLELWLERAERIRTQQRQWLKRRQAIEPAIGYAKSDHRMDRCWLQGATGDALHAVLCAAGFNIRWLLRAIAAEGLKALLLVFAQWALWLRWIRAASHFAPATRMAPTRLLASRSHYPSASTRGAWG
jgi:hypothetical protein